MAETALEIVYRDEGLVAVNKPSGLLVHRSKIDRHETRFALQLLRDQLGQRVYPLHRLDKPTSGILLFALNPELARSMMTQFESGQVSKTYLAVVRGYSDARGVIDYPLKEELDRMTDARAHQDKAAQEAVTQYRRLATVELPIAVGRYHTARYSLLEVTPQTGRKHQIRRHMKHIFHPLVGDTTHGDGRHNRMFRQHFELDRLLLHAWRMQLTHPLTGERLGLTAELDSCYTRVVEQLGWSDTVQAHTDIDSLREGVHADH